ncbi:MAG: tetratricopeptide repeat protein [Bacteroidetes bacterium]|nr:tetratricopeptide repeat protein [Bacteroidota bacterium]
MNLGVMLHHSEKFQEALVFFEKAYKLNPSNDLNLYNYSMLLCDLDRNSDALNLINSAIEINTTDEEYYNLKGTILISFNLLNDAVLEFKKAINIEPNYGTAYYNLGYTFGELKSHEQSIKYYDKACGLNFDLPVTLVNRAPQKAKINNLNGACQDLNRAYKLGRTDIQLLITKTCY